MIRWLAVSLVAVAGCGGEPAPEGYERWSGAGATFVYPEGWEEKEQPREFEQAGLEFAAGPPKDDARVLVMHDDGQSLEAFMTETLTTMPVELTPSIGPRERIDVSGAEEAIRREVTFAEGSMTIVFAAREVERHVALAVAEDVDQAAILRSFALE